MKPRKRLSDCLMHVTSISKHFDTISGNKYSMLQIDCFKYIALDSI
jgi:hypothetical protein